MVNLGGGNQPISLNDVIAKLEQWLGKKALIDNKPFHQADIKETWADISKAKRVLGWEPQISPFDGMKKSVEWYQENIDWLKDITL